MESIESLVARLTEYRNAYYNGTPLVSDLDYDEAEATLRERDPNNAFFSNVGAPGIGENKRKHTIAMGSQSKIKIEDDGINEVITKFIDTKACIVSYKMDGISFAVDYVNGEFQHATTRGDGFIGEDIPDATAFYNVPEEIMEDWTMTARGELVMSYKDFETVNSMLDDDKFSNPRNAVAGIARKKDSPFRKYITAYYYDAVGDAVKDCDYKHQIFGSLVMSFGLMGVVWYDLDATPDSFRELSERLNTERKNLPYMIDGLVIEFDDLEYAKGLGIANGNKPKSSVALKFDAVAETTHMILIVWQVGSTGCLTPVAEFEPTLIDGSIVSRASLHNYDIFKEWNLGVGDEIEVQKNNDIIPQLKRVVKHVGEKFKHPTHCPLCDTELVLETINTTNLKCPNLDCKCRALGNISKMIDKLNLNQKGLGDAFAEAYVAKYDNVYSLFTLSENDIKQLSDRYKDKSAKKIYDAIQSSKMCKLEDFFGLLNIEGCGSRTWKKVIEHFKCSTISHVVGLVYTEYIYSVGGIGESTVNSMRDGLLVKNNTIHELQGHLSLLVEEAPIVSDLGSFLFTGSFSVKRSELEKMVVAKGGTIASSVNKDLKYLVQSDPTSTSSKSEKAKKLGIAIIGEDEFMELIK